MQSTTKLIERERGRDEATSEVLGYKINIYNPLISPYTNNQNIKNEI